MGQIDNLNNSQLPDILRRLDRLERAAPMNNAAIGRGGIEVYDGGVIRITNGGLSVTGTATITGTLQADGTIAFTGTFTQSGPSTFTGTTNLNGPTNIAGITSITGNTTVTGDFTTNGPMKTTGTLSVEGVTTLKNDLNVTTGKINAGSVTIDPSHLSGSVKFSNGTTVSATPNGAQLVKSGGGAVTVSSGQADIGIPGGGAVIADGSGVSLAGISTTTSATNVRMDPVTGRLYRVVYVAGPTVGF